MGRVSVAANYFRFAARPVVVAMILGGVAFHGQSVEARPAFSGTATVQGFVRDSSGHPVAGATVCLQAKNGQSLATRTDPAGAYRFSAVHQGVYTLSTEMPGYGAATFGPIVLGEKESRAIDLTLDPAKTSEGQNSKGRPEFFDEPHFTVAGVTDTTNLGGHGSDTIVRNREALVKASVSLKEPSPAGSPSVSESITAEKSLRQTVLHQPESFDANHQLGALLLAEGKAHEGLPYLQQASRLMPGDYDNSYEIALAFAESGDYERARKNVQDLLAVKNKSNQERAEPHHLLAEIDEKLGNPLEAVREYQRAAELNPSESNLFDWGSELLLHHGVEPALEVFTKGNRLYPRSVRMLVGSWRFLVRSWFLRQRGTASLRSLGFGSQ